MATTRIDVWNNGGHETRRREIRRSGGDGGARAESMTGYPANMELAMKKLLRRIRGALGMGVTWALGWAPFGVPIGLIMEAVFGLAPGNLVGIWVASLAVLGLLGGAIFSGVLRLAEGRRSFDELSLPRFGAWGALGGLLLGFLAVTAGLVGAGFGPGLWLRSAVIIGTATFLSAGSASASLALARRTEERDLLDAGASTPNLLEETRS